MNELEGAARQWVRRHPYLVGAIIGLCIGLCVSPFVAARRPDIVALRMMDLAEATGRWCRRHPYLTGTFIGFCIGIPVGVVDAFWIGEKESIGFALGRAFLIAVIAGLLCRFGIPFYRALRGRP